MKPDPEKGNAQREYLKWAGAGIQMVVTIGAFTALGWWLDQQSANEIPGWTLGLSLTGCVLSLYNLIKSFLK